MLYEGFCDCNGLSLSILLSISVLVVAVVVFFFFFPRKEQSSVVGVARRYLCIIFWHNKI